METVAGKYGHAAYHNQWRSQGGGSPPPIEILATPLITTSTIDELFSRININDFERP